MQNVIRVVCVSVTVCLMMAFAAAAHADWGSTSGAGSPVTDANHLQLASGSDSNSGESGQSGQSSQSNSGNSSDSNSGESGSRDSSQSDPGDSSDSNSGDSGSGDSSQSNSGNSSDSNSGDSGSGESSNSGGSDSETSGNKTEPADNNSTTTGDPASADANSGNPLLGLAILSTSVGAAFGVYMWLSWQESPQMAKQQALELYLRQNAVAFASDVGTGAGPVVDDLAAMFGVSEDHRARFAQTLRRLYPQLQPVINRLHDDADASQRFIGLVVGAMREDAGLEADLVQAGFLKLTVHVSPHASLSADSPSKG